jgi:hypothetical protein
MQLGTGRLQHEQLVRRHDAVAAEMTASKEKEMKEMKAEMTVRLGSRDRKLADAVESKNAVAKSS